MSSSFQIGIVGPCKAGKSTLAQNLEKAGFQAKQIAQEHSFSPSMWKTIGNPDLLIYLNCSYESTQARGLKWLESEYDEQQLRLRHALENADLVLETDEESPKDILDKAVHFIDFEIKNKPLAE